MLWWFAETTLIAGLLSLVAMIAPRYFRLGPAARHALWLLVVMKLMTPPLVKCAWPFPSLKGLTRVVAAARTEPVTEVTPTAEAETESNIVQVVEINESVTVVDVETPPLENEAEEIAAAPLPQANPETPSPRLKLRSLNAERLVLSTWLTVSVILGLDQLVRILRFRRRLRHAKPAPEWLLDEAATVGAELRLGLPETLVVPGLEVPSLWCLGRPKLMLPKRLVETEGTERWRGILVHELAHLKRGDHWVSRLELLASLIWWWNPLFWFARHRLDAEAELACDAWVVSVLPEDRFRYAETLLEVCASLSRSKVPLPTLGIGGAGRLFERRLSMILHEKVSTRLSLPYVAGVGLLALFAAPTWVVAEPTEVKVETKVEAQVSEPEEKGEPEEATAPDEDEDDDKDRDEAKQKKKEKDEDDDKDGEKPKIDIDIDLSGLNELFGPKSEFLESLKKLTSEIQEQLGAGSDFEKQVREMGEKVGKEMELKFGPGSDFEKQVRDKFGPGSDFEKELKTKLGPHLEFNVRLHKHSDKTVEGKALLKDKERAAKLKAREAAVKSRRERMEAAVAEKREAEAKAHEAEADAKKLEAEAEAKAHEAEADAKKLEAEAEAKAHKAEADAKKLEAEARESSEREAHEKEGKAKAKGREMRIREIEEKLNLLLKELKSLKSEDE